ncbi:tetratricopeptide repeat protein [Streptomyces sp. CA-132043]|uniref:tetratricopeptide repeat protein n=1 Tax=Streptomyces sp. CA-132043 TaxID=3240048 RepID=UPI003D8A5D05
MDSGEAGTMERITVAADRSIVGFGPVKTLIGTVDKSAWPREALIGLRLISPEDPAGNAVRSEASLTDAAQAHERIRFFLRDRLIRNFRDVARAYLDSGGAPMVEVTNAERLDAGSRAFFEVMGNVPNVHVTLRLGATGDEGADSGDEAGDEGVLTRRPTATETRIDALAQAPALDAKEQDFLYEQAVDLLGVGDSWSAVRILEALLRHRNTPPVWGRLGLAHAMLGRTLEAEFCYLRWCEDPDPVSAAGAHYGLAMLYARHHPAHLRSLDRTAQHLEFGHEILQKAPSDTPDLEFHRVFNRNGYALVEFRRGRVQEAIQHLTEGIEKLRSGSGKHHMHQTVLIYNLAQCYRRSGNLPMAIETYEKLLAVDGNMPEYHMELAHCHLDAESFESALDALITARELGPSITEVHSLLGYTHLQLGLTEEAVASYHRAHLCAPRSYDTFYDYVYALAEAGRSAEVLAVATGRPTHDLTPEQHGGLLTLVAEQHTLLGNWAEARDALEHVLRLTPDHPDARTNLDLVVEAMA